MKSKKLLLVGGTNGSIHIKNYFNLISAYFDDVLVISQDKIDFHHHKTVNFSIKNPFVFLWNVFKMKRIINKYKPSVIHVHQANSFSFLTTLANNKKTPLIITTWGSDVLLLPEKGALYKYIVKYSLNRADFITADAAYMKEKIIKMGIKNKIMLANFGIDFETISDSSIKENIIYSNRLHERLYNVDKIILRFILGSVLVMICFFGMRLYSNKVEEYKINKAKRNIGILTISTFFFTIFILNPPEIIASIAKVISDNITFLEPVFEPLTREGVKPSQWGGLLINLMVAAAGCVLGFVIGVILAFWRQSNLPILKWPGIAIIEIVRSGPLICWLYFAMYLLPDVADPLFTNPEDFDNILRMMAIFSIFGGCYIAEVIRGGLQAVDKGQKEAALALGLSPLQIKLQVELPNAVRTTLPSIVSVFIGLWKDTTLLFIIEIIDFFRISKTMANTDLRFLGDFLEPVYFTALVFWIFAFYLSRVSMGVEKGLGLVKEGGGDAT